VFAGAAREAVFSNPEVIHRVNADFVPVALKAGLVNNPPLDQEGRLYREIGRSRPAPQGICVVNSAGKVLDWALMFDDDKSVIAFLDHCLRRFSQFPDAKNSFPAQRYMKYPSQQIDDVRDSGQAPVVPAQHDNRTNCPARAPIPRGTLVARLVGRALDHEGNPISETLRQEHYVEDRFHVPVAMQEALVRSVEHAGTSRFPLPLDLARLLASHAFLGQLDVNPVGSPVGKGSLKQCEFWLQKVERNGDGRDRLRLEGKSVAAGGPSEEGQRSDGRLWHHEVKLAWDGIIEMRNNRMSRLLLVARGSEKLNWGNAAWGLKERADVASLPGGHVIDMACAVRYGLIGEPAADEEMIAANEAGVNPSAIQDFPDEARKQLVEALGGPFLVFRDKVRHELKLSDKQWESLLQQFPEHVQATTATFERIKDAQPEEREREMQSHRRKSHEKLAARLNETLTPDQLRRLGQLELQREGPFALGRPDLVQKLKISDEQRRRFKGVVQEMQQQIEPLVKEAASRANPQEIGPKVMAIRKGHAAKLEAILSAAQRKQWKEMLGKPFELGD
jgi:hypothetical protein